MTASIRLSRSVLIPTLSGEAGCRMVLALEFTVDVAGDCAEDVTKKPARRPVRKTVFMKDRVCSRSEGTLFPGCIDRLDQSNDRPRLPGFGNGSHRNLVVFQYALRTVIAFHLRDRVHSNNITRFVNYFKGGTS